MSNHISTRVTQFAYFDAVLHRPTWKGSKILDFGGNIGGFLVGANDSVDRENYWCVDVDKTAVELGRRNHINAHFIHFDRYNAEFNPDGNRNLPIPNFGVEFDIIVAFSVFTHTHPCEMIELVAQLRSMLAPHGVLAFTFTDPSFDRSPSDPALPSGTGVREMLVRKTPENRALMGWTPLSRPKSIIS